MVSVCKGECKYFTKSFIHNHGMPRHLGHVNELRRWCKCCQIHVELHLHINNRCPCCKCRTRMTPRHNNSVAKREALGLIKRYSVEEDLLTPYVV